MRTLRLGASRVVNAASMGRVKLGWWSSPYRSDAAPIIIGGAPRSGTTLLRVMLDHHPDIWIGPENGVFQEGGRNLPGMEACLSLPMSTLEQLQRRSASLGEFIERAMSLALSREGKRVWGLKSPSVVHALGSVFHFFPNARFIHPIRDGRDVVCSLRTHPKYRRQGGRQVPTGIVNPWPDCVRRWAESTRAGLAWRGSPNYYELKYEDLVARPETIARQLLEWIGLPFDERVLQHHDRPANEGVDSPHPGIAQPVYTTAVSRWRTDLTEEGRSAFGPQDRALLTQLGYASEEAPPA